MTIQRRVLWSLVTVVGTTVPTLSFAQHGGHGGFGPAPRSSSTESPSAVRRPSEPSKPDQTIQISVGSEGFSPSDVTVRRGQRIRLLLRRVTDDTCAREFVLDEFLVWKRLPLNETVSDEFVTGRVGDFTFKCPGGAVSGTLHVVE